MAAIVMRVTAVTLIIQLPVTPSDQKSIRSTYQKNKINHIAHIWRRQCRCMCSFATDRNNYGNVRNRQKRPTVIIFL